MADGINTTSVVCVGGFDSSMNHFNMDTNFPGRASTLLNYEVGLNGGYRRISGFQYFDTNFPTVDSTNAEGRILGVMIYRKTSTNTEEVFAARKQIAGNTYKIYKHSPGLGWVAQVTGLPHLTVSGSYQVHKLRYATISLGGVNYMIVVDGVNKAMVYDGTTWRQLSISGTGTAASPGGNQLIENPAAVAIFKNHVFLSKDSGFDDIVVHSAPQDVFNWTAAAGAGQIPTGFEVCQIKPFRDNLFIFGYNEISRISVSGADFVINDVTKNIGCIAPDSVVEISSDLIFLSPDGIRPISATERNDDYQLASLSKQISYFIKTDIIESYDLEYLDSVVIREKSQFRYFVSGNSVTSVGKGLIGGIRSPDNSNAGEWEYSKLQGIRTSCATSGYIDREEAVLHGDHDGAVYQQENGTSFNGQNIISIYETPFLTFGDAKLRKMVRTVSTYYRLEGSLEMNIGLVFDWGDSRILNPVNFIQTNIADISQYGDGSIYGDGSTYGTVVASPLIQQDIEGSFHSIKLSYTTSDQNPSHSIHGFVIEFTQQARR
ncbi:hypothetical protein SmphiM6_18 [Sinorhizobium phage phiM6]|nr:hypothetical protein SmphiM6_18 [Sinorhizobium phage phiM6]